MSELSDQKKLHEVIKANSVATDDWYKAKKEWRLIYIYDNLSNCECGHHIRENCVIYNSETASTLVVGNVCINHFKEPHLNVPKAARACLTGIQNATRSTANGALLDVALRTKVLSADEVITYTRITTGPNSRNRFIPGHPKYNVLDSQKKAKVNRLIQMGFSAERPFCHCGTLTKPRQNSTSKKFFFSCDVGGRYEGDKWKSGCGFSKDVQ